jgi:hypothetical protein
MRCEFAIERDLGNNFDEPIECQNEARFHEPESDLSFCPFCRDAWARLHPEAKFRLLTKEEREAEDE